MRIAHATDIHFTEDVPLSRLPGKRLLGTANQILRGRKHHFPESVQRALVDHLLALQPDLLVITGDLTAQALPSEFEKALRYLRPALERQPSIVMPGNHDLYTRGARDQDRIGQYFGPWLHRSGALGHLGLDTIEVLALDPNRPTGLNASGRVPKAQLDALRERLNTPDPRPLILALHYPLVDREGVIYDGAHHGLLNARELIAVLASAVRVPALILHGHVHHGFEQIVQAGSHRIPIIDCGSSGYRFMPAKKRCAAMCVYTFEPKGFSVQRFLHDGSRFLEASS